MTMRPVADKAEISIDFPDKAYMGSFGRESRFDAVAEADGVALRLARGGEQKREVGALAEQRRRDDQIAYLSIGVED